MGKSKLEKLISKRIGQAIYKYDMIQPGDKIIVAASGGKDSMTLLYDLQKRNKEVPIPFEIMAVHIQTDFCTCCKKSDLAETFQKWGVKYEIVPVPVMGRLRKGKKMNCYWCSTQRRMELIKIAKERGFNKIALGHHMDDIAETLLMNICYNGEVSGMLPHFKYDKFSCDVIRPLALVHEKQIIKFAGEKGIHRLVCQCPYGRNSKRLEIRDTIKQLSMMNDSVKMNIFKSMANVNMEYMIENCK